ncbi:MAG: HNH endonuclease signature motif containing protein [Hyphomicrobium sp.]
MSKGQAIVYSTAEMRWLEANRLMVISDYHQAFRLEFGRPDVTAANLHALRKRKGWKIGRELARGRMVGRHTKYSAAEIAWLRDNCALVIGDYHKQFCAKFNRVDITAVALNQFRKKEGWKTGRTGQFTKGSVPWSKGKKIGNNPGSARTQFRKGRSPHNTKGAGHESIGDDGYVWIVTDRRNPWTGASTWRVHKHRWTWEQANGPVPEGMVLKCKDGNRLNTDPSNWELIPRGILPRLNGKRGRGYDEAPAELKPTIMAAAKLEHRLRERNRS